MILAVDQGTAGTRACVVDGDGALLAQSYLPHAAEPMEIWRGLARATEDARVLAGVPLEGLALASHGDLVVAWDRRDGRPLRATHGWAPGLLDESLEARALAADGHLGWSSLDAWLLHRLTGDYFTDASSASRTPLWDLAAGEWSPERCRRFGVHPSVLPEVRDSAGILARTREGVPVRAVLHGRSAALYGLGCVAPGDAVDLDGVVTVIVSGLPLTGEHARAVVAWRFGGASTFAVEGGSDAVRGVVVRTVDAALERDPALRGVASLARTVVA